MPRFFTVYMSKSELISFFWGELGGWGLGYHSFSYNSSFARLRSSNFPDWPNSEMPSQPDSLLLDNSYLISIQGFSALLSE